MKQLVVLSLASTMLVGCDDAPSPDAFSAEMASFSNEFDFDPLRGPVKAFSQTLINDAGEVALYVSGTLSREGCFTTLEIHDVENSSGASLVLNANFYLDAINQEKRVRLQGKCQLAELPASGLVYITDDSGFVHTAKNREAEISYRYDAEGYPIGRTAVTNDRRLEVDTVPADRRKKHDYHSETLLDNKPVTRTSQTCKYDERFNPLSCDLTITDMSVTPTAIERYRVENSIDYY